LSLTVYAGDAILAAIMGNVFVGAAALPARTGVTSDLLGSWDVFNTYST
jgi:hypothetical protein